MAPGANNRNTGTVPKQTKTRNNNVVPQEMVVPTRRDLQQLNVLADWASLTTSGNAATNNANNSASTNNNNLLGRSKPQNNRNESNNWDLGIDTNRFIPVRPILRRNILSDDQQQQQQHQQSENHQIHHQIATVHPTTPNIQAGTASRYQKNNIEERLNQIQEYIRITTSLIDSVQGEHNGARPQSVQSIHTNSSTPVNTPSASSVDDLNKKLDFSSRNMQNLKEQQAQLLRLQSAAKEQLRDMEQIRNSYIPDFNNVETVEQAQSNVANLMTRMNAIQQFIHNQNELCSLLGDDSGDVLAEQAALQNKLRELKSKKQQMENLVHELQNMNDEATQNFQAAAENDLTPTRMVGDHERIVPMEMTNVPSRIQRPPQNKNKPVAVNHLSTNHQQTGAAAAIINNGTQNGDAASDAEDMQDQAEADMEKHDEKVAQAKSALDNKISEITKMKEQLNRLKDMMNTVKLIEQKTGPIEDDDEEDNASDSRSPSVDSQISENVAGGLLHTNHDPPEREMAAKVNNQEAEEEGSTISSLANMTKGLEEQSRLIAKERERLRVAQAELRRRNETLGEQVQQKESTRLPRPVIPPRVPSPGPAERQQMMLKAELEARKNELENVSKTMAPKEKQQLLLKAELENKKKELDHIERLMGQQKRQAEAVRVSALNAASLLNTPPEPPTRSRFSTPPQQVPQAQVPQNPPAGSKDSADSGTGDLYAVPLDTASFQSDSTRSMHAIPPMPDLTARIPAWKRSMPPHQEPSIGSSANDFSNNSPWLPGLHFNGPPSSNAGPQSPNYPAFSDQLSYNPFNFSMQQQQQQYANATNVNDPLIIHHFMQTQQMLMNSISQCNNLLWIQQREINSLNNAVLLLQERILNPGVNNLLHPQESIGLHTIRAESTPPQINQPPTFNRGRCASEQPQNLQMPSFNPPFSPLYQQQSANQQSFSQQASSSTSSQQQIFRNNQAINQNNRNIRNMRASSNQTNATFYQQQQQHNTEQANSFMNLNNHFETSENEANFSSNMRQNNITATQSNLTYQNLASSASTNHNNINLLNNVHHPNNETLANGQIFPPQSCQTNFGVRQGTPTNLPSQQQQATPQALNNQVPPGNRANNYWDNFRSYSRQNLLSSNNSYKSNEEQHQSQLHHQINNPNMERIPQNMTRNINTNNIHDNNASKYNPSYNNRNNNSANAFINQLNGTASIVLSDVPGTSNNYTLQNQFMQQQQQQQPPGQHPPLNQSNSFDLGELEFHTNPVNLGVNEFSSKSKTLPKGSGNKKYSIPIRNRDHNSLQLEGAVGGSTENNNLNRSLPYQDPKSTSKLFEALKENVYHEVTNLISANESRPHFLIQLFRELQLISSDPLRQRTIQSIQELYNRYVESTIIQEENSSNSNVQLQQQQRGVSPRRNSEFDFNAQYGTPQVVRIKPINSPNPEATRVAMQNNANSYELQPMSQSTPQSGTSRQQVIPPPGSSAQIEEHQGASASPDAGFINSIMNEIISAVHAVDYINDSILQKVTNIVFNHVSDNTAQVSRLIINNDDFVRQLNHWNRTDKDEFITNLENYLNNILVECSNVAAGNITGSTTNQSTFNSTLEMDLTNNMSDTSPSNNATNGAGYSGFAIFVDGDLAEADQVCSNDENMEIEIGNVRHAIDEMGATGGGNNAGAAIHSFGGGIEEPNSEIIEDSESGLWDPSSPGINNHPATTDDSMNHNPNTSNNSQM
ncbi:putative uncharacterized protein DDB_G0271606 isoform X2 [Culicoides brevitarsis]|uniref:putative uncharacterized protein DDB_G0271606 isoform X2 n=1 Tax=Culicoides brevitarsis TaxID=469753 RepID=UPI00307C7EAB